ncbi:hypothetical protein A7A60_16360 [Acinetobacter baumannii]|nr:hypothetical protein A7A60_16360 [Acinetobacter baumannii]
MNFGYFKISICYNLSQFVKPLWHSVLLWFALYHGIGFTADIRCDYVHDLVWLTLQSVSLVQLNLAGYLNNKPVRGKGNLSILMDSNQKGFLPQQFEANNLFLVYAQNQLQATGNAQNLKIKLNAPALYELYPGLSGRAYGDLSVQSQPRLKATANIYQAQAQVFNSIPIKPLFK